jgi:asparagine N-glycosylation enzyme membrane subunit Stt3
MTPTIAKLGILLGVTSGFILIGYHEPSLKLIATSVMIDAALAPITAVIALRRGRSPILWAFIGFMFGTWALAAAMLWPTRGTAGRREVPPRAPEAA